FAFAPAILLGYEALVFRMSESGEDGFLIVTATEQAETLFSAIEARGPEFTAEVVGEAARDVLRIEAATPRYGLDLDVHSVIAETPLAQDAVSYTKGCYLGQEVVARLKAYGAPKFALMGLIVEDRNVSLPGPGATLVVGGKRVGVLRSAAFSPARDRWIALASLDRDHRAPGASLDLAARERGRPAPETTALRARVVALPFHTPPSRVEYAQSLYEQALERFQQDPEDRDQTAIHLLQNAVSLHPTYEDAYEALGVILHRQCRTEEAIRHMRTLAKLNPNAVMAHTNLSVFYVAKGMIREAEEEKALARQLEMKSQLDARAARQTADRERARIRREAEDRVAMFLEVLDIDPEDPVATLGLGGAYMQLEQYAEAAPFLETAVRVKKDYSAAYLKLGECRERLGDLAAAARVYRRGIEAASRKGDLMPLREMERRLAAIEATSETAGL
ncbi:MAG TPA: tetratricopeptide repeat protein, partial [Candidatus Hydrogenedentes bacterium]|nr:tetratricopeptide repeat protein [Candidatus Hydrogenedentota bacterium]